MKKVLNCFPARIILSSVILLLLLSPRIFGQIEINKLNDLTFGSVFKGYSYQVLDSDNNAALFTFISNTQHSANIEVRFSLPSNLKYSGYNVGITFDANHASWSLKNSLSGRTHFDPNGPLTINYLRGQKSVYIWLGGTIAPNTNVISGVYTATITMTVDIL